MGVVAPSLQDRQRATEIAGQFDIPLLDASCRPRDLEAGRGVLQLIDGVPSIALTGRDVPGAVTIDFADKSMARRRRGGHNELLGKAVGWKQAHAPGVLDATGGYGRDAFLLADLGCQVTVCERDPVMALLFGDALMRASASGDEWLASVVARMRLLDRDAVDLEASVLTAVDVIYLDPMFPLDRRAAPAKEMQVLHQLLAFEAANRHPEAEAQQAKSASEEQARNAQDAALLAWARAQDVRRVVVKRPRRAPAIPGPAVGHCLTGKSVRFDVYPVS
ncbi:conserved hypothetical protein [gamma proteobacterium NOR5-3]|nr:conserved hypothetical protein [gamma proteobacterium NOR5-3]